MVWSLALRGFSSTFSVLPGPASRCEPVVPLDSRAVLLFSGADGKNGAVSLVIEGVQYRLGPNGTVTLMPEPLSRPKLTISYTDEFNKPDVRNIAQGEF